MRDQPLDRRDFHKLTTAALGGLAAGAPRDLKLPLNFLPAGEYQSRVWQDADSPDPNQLSLRNVALRGNDALSLRIARDGGFVAIFEKR